MKSWLMFTVQHLQQQRNELQKQYELLSAQIQLLGESHAIEPNPVEEFKLKKQLEHAETKRHEVVEQIQVLEDQIEVLDNGSRLYKALLKLNYHNQVNLFLQLIERSQVGAFVIHGESEHGQSWLLNRLVRLVPRNMTGKVVSVNLQCLTHRWDIDALRYQLRRCASLTASHSLQEIAEQVHGWWQTQTVILIFHNLDVMDAKYIQKFFQDFWLPLVEKARSVPCPSPYYRLLMFLVDHGGSVDTWPISFAERLDSSWQPDIPIRPPRISRFPRDVLVKWIEHELETLPAKMRSIEVEDILKNSEDGIPQFVLEYICDLCDCDWFEREHIWIRY